MCRIVLRHFHPMPVHANETILSKQTGVAYCNVLSNFSGTHGLHVYLFSISSSTYGVGPGYARFAFYYHVKGILRTVKTGPTLYVGLHCLKTQVFPTILSIYSDDGHLVNKTDSDQAPHDATPGLYLTKKRRP